MKIKPFLFFFLICGCMSSKDPFDDERMRVTHSALRKFSKAMALKGYEAVGIGEGIDHETGKQNYLKVVFNVEALPNIDYARRIEVQSLQDFLYFINSEDGIQKYLVEYPFKIKFIKVSFISKDLQNGLSSVSNFENEIRYRKYKLDESIGPSDVVHEETFEEALKILTLPPKNGPIRNGDSYKLLE